MKVVTSNETTQISPFLKPDAEGGSDTRILIRKRGTIMLSQSSTITVMSTEAARTLAEALLHAVQIAQNGQK